MLSLGGWRMSNCQKARRNSAGPSVKMEAEHFLSRFSLLSTHACRWMTLLTVEGLAEVLWSSRHSKHGTTDHGHT
uniref:Uncharacterized protein n=1 Tax=Triticum urartu TaxID=4572 RepID=A0A8R7V948_TRIUA